MIWLKVRTRGLIGTHTKFSSKSQITIHVRSISLPVFTSLPQTWWDYSMDEFVCIAVESVCVDLYHSAFLGFLISSSSQNKDFWSYAPGVMGTKLSVSPVLRDEVDEHKRRSLSKPRLIVSAFGFKLVKQKSSKKVNPNPLPLQTIHSREDLKAPSQNCPSQSGETETASLEQNLEQTKFPVTKQLENVQKQQPSSQSPVRIVVQASTGELLLCLGRFLRRRCLNISDLTSNEVIAWIRNVDRTLLMQGWQEEGFITPSILVFVYLLCRDAVTEDITSPDDLQGIFLTCLYLTYSYLGTEISYPLQPFIINANKNVFWQQSLEIIDKLSSEMLRINMEPKFFTEVFQELKQEGEVKNRNCLDRWSSRFQTSKQSSLRESFTYFNIFVSFKHK